GIASAHVTANVTEPAKKGGYAKITFRVPNEDDTQGTIKLTLNFPANPPVTSARPKPVPGWTTSVTKIDLNPPVTVGKSTYKQAIGTITWTAQPGTRINPGEFQEFDISAGPLPSADQLVIPATEFGREPDLKTHEGYEWLYVLNGRLRLVLGTEDLVMKPGEAAEFDTHLPHWMSTADGQPVELLILFGPQGERAHLRVRPKE
ncbi:DUF1775 domain-containing protein, partial [Kibdelosporangium lantanae]